MLHWNTKWGKHLKTWLKQYEEGGNPPRPFYDRPDVRDDLMYLWTAFQELSTERQIGMAVGPIPASMIKEYGRGELGFGADALDWFCAVIRKVDDEYTSGANSSPSKPGDPKNVVPVTDVDGARQLFRNLAARKDNEARKKQ